MNCKHIKHMAALLLFGSMLLSVGGCLSLEEESAGGGRTESVPQATFEQSAIRVTPTGETGTRLSASGDGTLTIDRSRRETVTPMGAEGTWTVFVYMCGSDLESEDGSGTEDLEEMQAAATGSNVRFVVQTGGAEEWSAGEVDPDRLDRFVICDGDIKKVGSEPGASMGDGSTLANFLAWGIASYPAANMGLVLWNHGSGSICGVCFDELYEDDSLSLPELGSALECVYPDMTDTFRFIGFDACLMATVETANMLVPHGDYMYASQDTEPGYGWDYTALGDYLGSHPETDGAALGKLVCDSYYDACVDCGSGEEATFSCTDLSRMDAFMQSWNETARQMYALTENPEQLAELVRGITGALNFGGNNKAEGYTNMVDAGCILENTRRLLPGAKDTLTALEACVTYRRNGERRQDATGLATYYPLCIQGSEELSVFRNVCISPWYLSFVDKIAYGADHEGMLEGYRKDLWMGEDSLFWSEDALETSDWSWAYWNRDQGISIGLPGEDGETHVEYDTEPYMDEDGSYMFQLSEESLWETDSVYNCLYMILEDERLLDLGADDDVYMDWDTGEVYDCFDGYWFALPDGQPLAAFIAERGEDYNIYAAPIILNGVDTNLRIRQDYGGYGYPDMTTTILGVWDGIDTDSGQAARTIRPLNKGDVIEPRYSAYDPESWEESTFVGSEFVYTGDPALEEFILPDGDYYYGFCINDIYGGETYTDYVIYNVEGEDVYYYE